MAQDFNALARTILDKVGGEKNVAQVTHCMTRLRFNLKDESKAVPDDEMKAVKGVLGVVRSGGQYQVIIGQTVNKVYEEVNKLGSFGGGAPVEKVKEKLTLKKIGMNILNYLAGSLTPLIPVIIAAAMVKTVLAVIGPSMLGLVHEGDNLYTLLTFVGDVFVCHPGYLDAYIMRVSSLTIPRTLEVEMACSDELRHFIQENDIQMLTYDDV